MAGLDAKIHHAGRIQTDVGRAWLDRVALQLSSTKRRRRYDLLLSLPHMSQYDVVTTSLELHGTITIVLKHKPNMHY